MKPLSQEAFDQIFVQARTHTAWLPQPVTAETLHQVYDLAKWGATSANCCPARFVFVHTPAGKEKLLPCLAEGNIAKTKSAPVTVIIAHDMEFYEKLPKLAPHGDVRSWFVGNDALIQSTAFRNGTLQGAYLMIAARAHGLDCGPMSGFDNAKMDAAFFAGTKWKSNFICNLGYGDASKLHPRAPRLDFDEACKVI